MPQTLSMPSGRTGRGRAPYCLRQRPLERVAASSGRCKPLLLEAHHERSRIGFSDRLAAALDRDLVHPGVRDRVRRNDRIELVAADELRLQLLAVQEHLMEGPKPPALHL